MSKLSSSSDSNQRFKPLIWAVSIVVPLVVALLLNPRIPKIELGFDTYIFPKINAAINSTVSLLLIAGYIFIRRGQRKLHQYAMVSAFALSALFLVSYVLYHMSTASTPHCEGSPVPRALYLIILFSHIALSVTIIPLASFSIFHALGSRFDAHKRLTRYTFPLWLYVSITGVLVYLFISPCYPG